MRDLAADLELLSTESRVGTRAALNLDSPAELPNAYALLHFAEIRRESRGPMLGGSHLRVDAVQIRGLRGADFDLRDLRDGLRQDLEQ